MKRIQLGWAAMALAAACSGTLDATDEEDAGVERIDAASPRDAGPPADCPAADTRGLTFDGVGDHASMGPTLGLERFTLEAWARRDGEGVTTATGSGGLQLVPIAGKGRGEDDGSDVDCNYALGYAGDVLGADFEDAASGANHPVRGTTPIELGVWHHVAMTFDGTALRLYLDGALDGETRTSAEPRADSIQHFGLGAAFDSTGVAQGRLHGALDEVRVWDRALTEEEIATGMHGTMDAAAGLVAYWTLGEGETDATTPDSVGTTHGTLTGTREIAPGAPLTEGVPPTIELVSPAEGAVVTGTSVELEVSVDDPDTREHTIAFYARELVEAEDFTIAVMPDTQYYADAPRGWDEYFHDQTRWIAANRAAYNIVAVIHNGDVVEHGNRDRPAWVIADAAMRRLEPAYPGGEDGIPYGISVGNHDQSPLGTFGGTASFNEWFGVRRFQGRVYYGGHYGSKNDESWITFSAGGLDFVVVNLQYDTTPNTAIIAWARGIFEAHPDAIGILNSHYILKLDGTFGTQGNAIYQGLKDVDNVQLMTCGHVPGESRRTDTFEGNVIHSMLADYQGRTHGGDGWMRLWEFSPANDELTVRTYTPSLDRWETDSNSEFTLPVDLPGIAGELALRGTVTAPRGQVSVTMEGLTPGREYEWFAVVTSCGQAARTPVGRFVAGS